MREEKCQIVHDDMGDGYVVQCPDMGDSFYGTPAWFLLCFLVGMLLARR